MTYPNRPALIVAVLLCSAGCDTMNVNNGPYGPWGAQVTIVAGPTATANYAGEDFTWTASWVGGTAPFSVSWSFGEDFDPGFAAVASSSGSSDSQTVVLKNPEGSMGHVSCTVTDVQGLPSTDSEDYSYGPKQNQLPVLTVVSGDGTTSITIRPDDADGDSVQIVPTAPSGFTGSGAQTVASGSEATFDFVAADILWGGTGTAFFDGNDGFGLAAQIAVTVTQDPIILAPDTLYAIPLQGTASFGDTVTIIVATGIPANPFQFLNGCRVTAPVGFEYATNTFNVGLPGGNAGDVDGFWTAMNPGSGFLLAPDNFIFEYDLGGGLTGISFNCTPIGGADQIPPAGRSSTSARPLRRDITCSAFSKLPLTSSAPTTAMARQPSTTGATSLTTTPACRTA